MRPAPQVIIENRAPIMTNSREFENRASKMAQSNQFENRVSVQSREFEGSRVSRSSASKKLEVVSKEIEEEKRVKSRSSIFNEVMR